MPSTQRSTGGPALIPVRQGRDAKGLRLLAGLEKAGKVVRRLLGIAHILDGRPRSAAAELVGLALRGLTRAVKRYNAEGVDGLRDRKIPGRPCRLTPEPETALKRLVLAGPQERETGRAEFRICDIVALIERTWGIRMSAEAVRTKRPALKLEKLVCRPQHHEADPDAPAAFQAGFAERLAQIARDHPEASRIEVWVQDESRVGQKSTVVRRWAAKGRRPRALVQGGFKPAWLFGAFCPERDPGVSIVVETLSSEAMSAHLALISQAVLPTHHAAVLRDGAGIHAAAKDLVVPPNITLVSLPAHSPDLSPPEGVWRFLKGGYLAHQLYRSVDEIIAKCCAAWRSLLSEPGRIRSLCSYPWLMVRPAPT